ncbi:alpha/beta fold hydrolase [Rhizobium sp. PAMB 3174]
MFSQLEFLDAPSGARIAWRHKAAAGAPLGVVLICHGLAEHSGRYASFADVLSDSGFHVYAHDHRGHGETRAPDAPIGRFAVRDGVDKVIADVIAMRDLAAARHPGLPVILFGHSMGGLISFNTAVAHPEKFSAVTVWNSNFHLGAGRYLALGVLKTERMLMGSDVPSFVMPKATFDAWGRSIPGNHPASAWLSRIPEEVDKYDADPLCGFDASISMWLDVMELSARPLRPDQLSRLPNDFPIYLVGGGEDPATNKGKAIRWLSDHLKRLGYRDVTTIINSEARHETLNDIGREKAAADFAVWCVNVCKRTPGAAA